jgi:hypothetical protein
VINIHHLLKEKDQLNNCFYCGNDLKNNRWVSDFSEGFHYKISLCNCGRCNSIRETILQGSGHDDWDGTWFNFEEFKKMKKNVCLEKKLRPFF